MHERALSNQNVEFNELARSRAKPLGVGLVPFYNLTAPRFDMHRRHFCSYSNQVKVGRCCDCTHLCYTPLFWDAFFAGLRDTIMMHPGFLVAGGLAERADASQRRGGGGRGGRGGGGGGRRGRARGGGRRGHGLWRGDRGKRRRGRGEQRAAVV